VADTDLSKASSFTLKELSGQGRTVRLTGRALPYPPYTLSGTMRLDTTWYPGNPEATIQFFGAAEDETTINGYWKDRFIKPGGGDESSPATIDGEPVADVFDLVKKVDDIRRQGQLLEVTWDETLRHGAISKFEQKWNRRQDVEWSITFVWISQGEGTVPAVFPQAATLGDLRSTFVDQVTALEEIAIPPLPAPATLMDKINAALDKLSTAVDAIGDAIAAQINGLLSPLQTAQRAQGIMNSIIADAGQLIVSLEVPAATLLSLPSGVAATLGEVATMANFSRNLIAGAREMQHRATEERARISQNTTAPLIVPYRVRDGEDLRTIAMRYYGNANAWRALALFNQLTNAAPVQGRVILIPSPTKGV